MERREKTYKRREVATRTVTRAASQRLDYQFPEIWLRRLSVAGVVGGADRGGEGEGVGSVGCGGWGSHGYEEEGREGG